MKREKKYLPVAEHDVVDGVAHAEPVEHCILHSRCTAGLGAASEGSWTAAVVTWAVLQTCQYSGTQGTFVQE